MRCNFIEVCIIFCLCTVRNLRVRMVQRFSLILILFPFFSFSTMQIIPETNSNFSGEPTMHEEESVHII